MSSRDPTIGDHFRSQFVNHLWGFVSRWSGERQGAPDRTQLQSHVRSREDEAARRGPFLQRPMEDDFFVFEVASMVNFVKLGCVCVFETFCFGLSILNINVDFFQKVKVFFGRDGVRGILNWGGCVSILPWWIASGAV